MLEATEGMINLAGLARGPVEPHKPDILALVYLSLNDVPSAVERSPVDHHNGHPILRIIDVLEVGELRSDHLLLVQGRDHYCYFRIRRKVLRRRGPPENKRAQKKKVPKDG